MVFTLRTGGWPRDGECWWLHNSVQPGLPRSTHIKKSDLPHPEFLCGSWLGPSRSLTLGGSSRLSSYAETVACMQAVRMSPWACGPSFDRTTSPHEIAHDRAAAWRSDHRQNATLNLRSSWP